MNLIDRIKRADENKGPWPTGVELILAISISEKRVEEMEEVLGFAEQWLSAFSTPPIDGSDTDSWARGHKRVLARLRSALHIPRG